MARPAAPIACPAAPCPAPRIIADADPAVGTGLTAIEPALAAGDPVVPATALDTPAVLPTLDPAAPGTGCRVGKVLELLSALQAANNSTANQHAKMLRPMATSKGHVRIHPLGSEAAVALTATFLSKSVQ
jgi:hypothetical protein